MRILLQWGEMGVGMGPRQWHGNVEGASMAARVGVVVRGAWGVGWGTRRVGDELATQLRTE